MSAEEGQQGTQAGGSEHQHAKNSCILGYLNRVTHTPLIHPLKLEDATQDVSDASVRTGGASNAAQ